jgi:hypothetical protein
LIPNADGLTVFFAALRSHYADDPFARQAEASLDGNAEVIVMAKSKSKIVESVPNQSTQGTDSDIARRAYDLYLARGCEHGHDVDDWLKAERDLRETRRSNAA